MAQVQSQPAPAPATAGAPATSTTPAATENVPRLLNRWQLVAVAACVLFGLVAAGLQVLSWQSSGRAADNTEQLIRVQEIQASLLRADALATNAFLIGGLEPAEQRAEYDATLDQVLRLVADAADAQPADREALAALNAEVAAYASTIAQARDYNRQALPVGAEYLRTAGADLRAEALPILQALVDANTARAEDEMGAQPTLLLLLAGLLAVLALWWVNQQIAARFRRRINVGLAIAAATIGVLTVLAAFHSSSRSSENDGLREGSFAAAVDAATARTAANDAKANESLRLIARGSGATYEDRWAAAAAVVKAHLPDEVAEDWKAYVGQHAQVVGLDEAGKWEQAVALATRTDGGSSAALDGVDQSLRTEAETEGAETTEALASGRWLALVLALAALVAGLVAAWFANRGIDQRRKEYA